MNLRQHKRRAAAATKARVILARAVTSRHFGGMPAHLSVTVGFQVVSYQHPRSRGGRKVRWQNTPAVRINDRMIPRLL